MPETRLLTRVASFLSGLRYALDDRRFESLSGEASRLAGLMDSYVLEHGDATDPATEPLLTQAGTYKSFGGAE